MQFTSCRSASCASFVVGIPSRARQASRLAKASPSVRWFQQTKRGDLTIGLTGTKIAHDSALGGDANVVADRQVLSDANLTADLHIVAERRTARNASLRRNHAASTKLHIMANLDLRAYDGLTCTNELQSRAKECMQLTKLSSLQPRPMTVFLQLPRSIVQLALLQTRHL